MNTQSNFKVHGKLGQGNQGDVYIVTDMKLKQKFAAKLIKKQPIDQTNFYKQLFQERDILQQIKSPFIAKTFCYFQNEDYLIQINELGVGGSLDFNMSQVSSLSETEACKYICQLILAIEYLHNQMIIVRDMKLENIVLDDKGNMLLIDLGYAHQLKQHDEEVFGYVGTLPYMSPEVINNQPYSKPYDIYIIGIIFYELITGIHPFISDSKEKIVQNILRNQIDQNNMSSKVYNLIKKLMSYDQKQRPTIQQLKNDEYFKNVNWNDVYDKKIEFNLQPQYIQIEKNIDQAIFTIKNFNKYRLNYIPNWNFEQNGIFGEETSISLINQSEEMTILNDQQKEVGVITNKNISIIILSISFNSIQFYYIIIFIIFYFYHYYKYSLFCKFNIIFIILYGRLIMKVFSIFLI